MGKGGAPRRGRGGSEAEVKTIMRTGERGKGRFRKKGVGEAGEKEKAIPVKTGRKKLLVYYSGKGGEQKGKVSRKRIDDPWG